ncbi:4018_t:CDS:2 [Ambispora gerdemannii]|uniref:4018_t:CDS:1 n=1 Tax=Ambispora gerdemannii TaxID=144530 RepID=A0A9N9D2W8_9GLOM|nr:4018_t:CDS:2 [Ambispora gerdemannii]
MKNIIDNLNIVTIQVGDDYADIQMFVVNKLVLQEKSAYFAAAFSNKWTTIKDDKCYFRKPNISASVFEALLRYLNTDVFDLSVYDPSACLDLLIASDEMIFDDLLEKVQTYLIEHEKLWLETMIIDVLNIIVPRPACFQLRNYCINEIVERDARLLFESPKFSLLEENVLLLLVGNDELNIKEIDIWKNLIRWGLDNINNISDRNIDECKLLQQTLCKFLPLIRFFQISPNEFDRYVRPYEKILSEKLLEEYSQFRFTGIIPITNRIIEPRLPPLRIESKIIKPKHAALISSWINGKSEIGQSVPYTFKRIYRASTDGISGKAFHEKCDRAGPTIILVKSSGSEQILGGYNPLKNGWKRGWFSSNHQTDFAFIFSFDNGRNLSNAKISRIKENAKHCALVDHPWDGPCFGAGPDLWVSINCSKKIGQVVNDTYEMGIKDHDVFFYWDDWEVFQIIKNKY